MIFDGVKKSKGFIWFLIAVNFVYFTQLYAFVDGYYLIVRPNPRLLSAWSAAKNVLRAALTPESASADVLDGVVELESVSDTPDPFSPDGNGQGDDVVVEARFRLDGQKLRNHRDQTGGTAQYFLDWKWQIVSEVVKLGGMGVAVESSSMADTAVYPQANVMDDKPLDDPAGYWLADPGDPDVRLTLRFPEATAASGVRIYNSRANGFGNPWGTRDFSLYLSSDGIQYEFVVTGTFPTLQSQTALDLSFPVRHIRALRIEVDTFYGFGGGLAEVQLLFPVSDTTFVLPDSATTAFRHERTAIDPAILVGADPLLSVFAAWDGKDRNGKISGETTHVYRVQGAVVSDEDTAPPVITLTNVRDGDWVNERELRIRGFLNERGTVSFNGGAPVEVNPMDKSFVSDSIPIAVGENYFTLTATDVFGQATAMNLAVHGDFTAPQARWVSPSGAVTVTSRAIDIEVEVSDDRCGVDTAAVRVLVNDDARTVEDAAVVFTDSSTGRLTGKITLDPGLLVGDNVLELRITDRAGNPATARLEIKCVPPPAVPDNRGMIFGEVRDANSNLAVSNASVTVDGFEGGTLTGADGRFELAVQPDRPALVRIEKTGFSRVRKYAQVNSGRSRRLEPAYIVPLETIADTIVGKYGGVGSMEGGTVRISFAPGAFHGQLPIRAAVYRDIENRPVRPPLDATVLQEIEARPSGVEFDVPPALFLKNMLGLSPGARLPVAVWDGVKQLWVSRPDAKLTPDAAFFTTTLDRLQTIALLTLTATYPGTKREDLFATLGGGAGGDGTHGVSYPEGFLTQSVSIPWTRILGQEKSIDLVYQSNTADPSQAFGLVKTALKGLDQKPAFVDVKISLEDVYEEKRFVGKIGESAFNYFWNGLDPERTQKVKTGLYRYEVRLDDAFSGMPVYYSQGLTQTTRVQQPMGLPSPAVYGSTRRGRALLNNRSAGPFGRGWWMQGVEKLGFDVDGTPYLLNASGTPRFFIESFHDTPAGNLSDPADVFPVAGSPETKLYGISPDGRVWVTSDTDGVFTELMSGIGQIGDLVLAGKRFDKLVILQPAARRLVVADLSGRILRYIDSNVLNGKVVRMTSPAGFPMGLAVDASGQVFIADGNAILVSDVDMGDLDFFTQNPLPSPAKGIGILPDGDLVISSNYTLYRVDRQQNVTIIGTLPISGGKIRVDQRGNILVMGATGGQMAIANVYGDAASYLELPYGLTNFYITADTLYLPRPEGEVFFHSRKGHFVEIDAPRAHYAHIRISADGLYELTERDISKKIFDAHGNHVETVDPNGNRTVMTYENPATDPLLTAITNAMGQTVTFSYTNGRLSRIVDHTGRTTQVGIDAAGDLVSVTRPDGSLLRFAYEGRGRMVSKTEPKGSQTAYLYDDLGRVKERVNPLGKRSFYEPQEVQGLINVMAVNVGTRTNPAAAPNPPVARYIDLNNATRTMRYGVLGLAVKTTEPDGLTTQTLRDMSGRPTLIDRPAEDDRAFFYLTENGCACGNVSRIDEGGAGGDPLRILNVRTSQSFEYDPRHHKVVKSVDQLGRTTSTVYDDAGNPLRVIDADGRVTTMEYDARGLVTIVRDPTGKETQFRYDAFGNTDQTVDPLGNVTGLAYDPTGNVNQVSDPSGRKTKFEYDEMDKLTKVTDPNGKITGYEYDLNGNLTKITDALGSVTQFFYDAENRLGRRVNAVGQEENFAYDPAGNLIEKRKADGTDITFKYDKNNRLLEKNTPDDAVIFDYDPQGRLIGVKDDDSRLRMGYDASNRVVRQDQAGFTAYEFTIRYEYDLGGNRVSMRHSEMPPQTRVSYAYDTQSRVTRIQDQYDEVIDFSYDASGNRTRMSRNAGRLVSTWAYDNKNRVTDIEHAFDGTLKSFFRYVYNVNDNRTSMTDRHGVRAYTYDNLDRLTAVSFTPDPLNPQSAALAASLAEDFTYDPVGNRLADARTDSYAYDPANRIQTDGIYAYTFDGNGNMTGKQLIDASAASSDTPAVTRYLYDAEDRLVRVQIFNAGLGPVPDKTVRYRYDGLGRRTEKTVFNGLAQGDIISYFYDEEDIVSRRVTPGSPVQWVQKPAVGEIRTSVLRGQTAYLATDRGVVLMNTTDGTQRRWDASSGHLRSDNVRDVFVYDGTKDTWNRSGAGKTWAALGDFPLHALIVATDREVAIIDLSTEQVYTRFERGEHNALTDTVSYAYEESAVGGVAFFNRVLRGAVINPPWVVPENLNDDRRRPHQVGMIEGKLFVASMIEKVDLNHLEDRNIDGNLGDAKEKESLVRMGASPSSGAGGGAEMFDFVNDQVYIKFPGEHTFMIGAFSGRRLLDKPIFRWYRGGIGDANAGLGFDMHVEATFGGLTSNWNWVRDMKVIEGPTGKRFLSVVRKEGMVGDADDNFVSLGYGAGGVLLFPSDMDTRITTMFEVSSVASLLEGFSMTSRGEPYASQPKLRFDGFPPSFLLPDFTVDVDTDIYRRDGRFIFWENNGNIILMADSSAAHVRAFLEDRPFEGGFSVGVGHFYQHGMARDANGEIRPKAIEIIENASGLNSGNHRIFVGSADGLTMIDEAAGTLNFAVTPDTDFADRGVLPWDRVNKAKYYTYSPRALTDGQMQTDRVDQILALDKDHVIIVQHGGYGQGDAPTIALLDLTALQHERKEFYTHGPGWDDEHLILHVENPTTKEITTDYYLSDAIGSITELVSRDGTITGELSYNSFGKIVHSSGNALDQVYHFTGREYEKEWGGYYYRARYYEPLLGRFLSEDILDKNVTRIFDAGGRFRGEERPDYTHQEGYIYVDNNPIKYIDPFGLAGWEKTFPGGYRVVFHPGIPGYEAPNLHVFRGAKKVGRYVLPKEFVNLPNKLQKHLAKGGLGKLFSATMKRMFLIIALTEGLADYASGVELEETAAEVAKSTREALESFIGEPLPAE